MINEQCLAASLCALAEASVKWSEMMAREAANPTPPLELSPETEARFHAWLRENGDSCLLSN